MLLLMKINITIYFIFFVVCEILFGTLTSAQNNGDLRLTETNSGQLEVYYYGWGFICDNGWDTIDANTTCKILGYERVITSSTGRYNASTNYRLTNINCRGNEARILNCSYSTTAYCYNNDHIYMECGPVNGELRLTGGESGLLEVYYNGWGFICDDGWDSVDANTVCRILGHDNANFTGKSRYHSSTDYKLNYINCSGFETNILNCGYSGYSPSSCSQHEHIYISCKPTNGDIRLTGSFSGLLEVFYNGWGFICDYGWDTIDANTTCKILGYETVITTSTGRYNESSTYKLNYINCRGNEERILDCGYTPNDIYYYYYYRYRCNGNYHHIYLECGPVNGDLRLTGRDSGLLEVYYNGWGFICDDGWDSVDANTVCQLLGYDNASSSKINRYHSSTNYKINFINCRGNETNILDCGYRIYSLGYCSQSEHIYISCTPLYGDLRLSGGFKGLLEVFYNGWGYICDNSWSTIDANTTCKILGFETAIASFTGRYNVSTNYKLSNINCQGNEERILDCDFSTSFYCYSYDHIYLECGPVKGEVRLTNGDNGLLEVYSNGWGFICDNEWDNIDAYTVCQLLGLDNATSTGKGRHHISTNYKLNNINCRGNESSILNCGYSVVDSQHSCSQYDHIYISCTPLYGDIRLTGGFSGLLEVFHNGWGFICDNGWDTIDANTTCKILGYIGVISSLKGRYNASTNYKLHNINCRGNEERILDCGHSTTTRTYYCSNYDHIYLECGPVNGDLRLTGIDNGLIEVYYNGWGFICDDGWNTTDANTTCKLLGYERVIRTSTGRYNVSTNYKLNNISCRGNEERILDCDFSTSFYCHASKHIYLECWPVNGDLRLSNGDNGLLEVYYNGWGFICDYGWDINDANTTCKILGFERVITTSIGIYDARYYTYKMSFINCRGNERRLLDCGYSTSSARCYSENHIYIDCGPVNGNLRLSDGDSGLLEVYYNGWGFICDDSWDNDDANTACRSLGHNFANSTEINRYRSSTNYKLNNIKCKGTEANILDCGYRVYNSNVCSENEHIYLSCTPNKQGDLRLTGRDSGLLEVYYNGWGFICDRGWDSVDAITVCKLLGHDTVNSTEKSKYHHDINYKLYYINCIGNETSILDCGFNIYRQGHCSQNEHIYISCAPSYGELRLTGEFSGLLEVFYNGWGFICSYGWDINDANTTCKILGYERAITTSTGRYDASTNYKLSHISCRGNEKSILDCGFSTSLSCNVDQHIFIECGPVNGDLRLTEGDSGLLEVYYNGWGFICDDGWENLDANIVCKILGYNTSEYSEIGRFHGKTNYKLNYIKCRGNETAILKCDHRIYQPDECSQNEHIYLLCTAALSTLTTNDTLPKTTVLPNLQNDVLIGSIIPLSVVIIILITVMVIIIIIYIVNKKKSKKFTSLNDFDRSSPDSTLNALSGNPTQTEFLRENVERTKSGNIKHTTNVEKLPSNIQLDVLSAEEPCYAIIDEMQSTSIEYENNPKLEQLEGKKEKYYSNLGKGAKDENEPLESDGKSYESRKQHGYSKIDETDDCEKNYIPL